MKLKSILTEINDFVNQDNTIFWIFVVILIGSLFYMIGWISNEFEEGESIEINNTPEMSEEI